ncbi:hypothetical protein SBA6_410050 [Candidatus Sulfopaludibacter sp. SbA6]|nr:hypothetical protein SBA6_410050 [Candidatus Sulfopaludibacter sp. SbA6]
MGGRWLGVVGGAEVAGLSRLGPKVLENRIDRRLAISALN